MVIKSKKNVLYCRVGWMDFYNLELCPFDKINGGGNYPDKYKFDVYNFQNLNGKYYGFLQVRKNTKIAIEKLNVKKGNCAKNVLVIWFAKKPNSNKYFVVGLYDNATVYCKYEKVPKKFKKRRKERKVSMYNIISNKAILFNLKNRKIVIPNDFPGECQYTFANDPQRVNNKEKKETSDNIIKKLSSLKI